MSVPLLSIQPLVPATEDMRRNPVAGTTSSPRSPVEPYEVHSENLFQRTEVLAGRHDGHFCYEPLYVGLLC